MKKFMLILVSLCIISIPIYPGGNKETPVSEKPIIAVSILPQKYAVDRIAGDLVETFVLVTEGQSPHSYEPTPRQMSLLANASAWILSGTDFEITLIKKISSLYPNLLIVDGTQGVTFRLLENHSHDDGEETTHENDPNQLLYDKHTWLSHTPYKILIDHIYETLVSLDHQNKDVYSANKDELIGEIDSLFASLQKDLAPLKGSTVFVFHPSFGYFFDEFGIIQEAVETGGKEPTAKNLVSLIENARKENIKAIFVQAQFPTQAAENIATSVGAKVLPLDPLAYDWITNIKSIASVLKEVSTY